MLRSAISVGLATVALFVLAAPATATATWLTDEEGKAVPKGTTVTAA